jgi:O-acetyl-ADP-ribose deacetylase (regulator of RNase III)
MEYIKKNIITVTEGVILHGVNCLGAMGSGVAGVLRTAYPVIYDSYITKYNSVDNPRDLLGEIDVVNINESLYIINAFTQYNCGYDGKKYASVDAIYKCLSNVYDWCDSVNMYDIYLPPIGCGLGGLNWDNDVKPIFEILDPYKNTKINITVCDI